MSDFSADAPLQLALDEAFPGRVRASGEKGEDKETPPLCVADVAARLQLNEKANAKPLAPPDGAALARLLPLREKTLPPQLSPRALQEFFAALGVPVSPRLQEQFQEAAVFLQMGQPAAPGATNLAARANWTIPQLIEALYADAAVPLPMATRPVTPLRRLLRGQCLNHAELPSLSARAASEFLLRHGALREALPNATKEPLAAFLYANSGGACLFVRREDPIARRRFSIAHELGHYLLHFSRVAAVAPQGEFIEALPPAVNPESEEASHGTVHSSAAGALPAPDEMEHEADAFAAELLMPATVVRALAAPFRTQCSDYDLARRLATDLLVSRAAMLLRLRHLGLLRGEAVLN